MSEAFREKVRDLARDAGPLVLAFDIDSNPFRLKNPDERLGERLRVCTHANEVLSELKGLVAGVKLGLPFIVGIGPDRAEELIGSFRDSYFFVCDSKMADIGYVNRLVAEQLFDMGFDGLIIHAAIGVKGGLDEVIEAAARVDRGVLAVCAMTHPGAEEHLNPHFESLLDLAIKAGADGLILPATFPDYISKARKLHPRTLILSPGVGAQGAPFGSAISAGADLEIVGRAIYGAARPAEKAREILTGMRHELRHL